MRGVIGLVLVTGGLALGASLLMGKDPLALLSSASSSSAAASGHAPLTPRPEDGAPAILTTGAHTGGTAQ